MEKKELKENYRRGGRRKLGAADNGYGRQVNATTSYHSSSSSSPRTSFIFRSRSNTNSTDKSQSWWRRSAKWLQIMVMPLLVIPGLE